MKKLLSAAMALLMLCLAGMTAGAEAEGIGIAGKWYTEEIMMTVTEEGRFNLEWFDGDWTGTLEEEWRLNEEGEEVPVYRLMLDNPELANGEETELVGNPYHPGELTYYQDGNPRETFWNVPAYVMEMDEEDPEVYAPYFTVDAADGEEPQVMLMITLLRPATDISVMKMFDQEIDEDGMLAYSAEPLMQWEALDSRERILVTDVVEGDLPDLMLAFTDEEGISWCYMVQFSGADGKPDLMEAPAG